MFMWNTPPFTVIRLLTEYIIRDMAIGSLEMLITLCALNHR